MDAAYGLPTGMFNGDELLPSPPTRNPSRGIETCGVVEAMFSYTTMFSEFGDARFFITVRRHKFGVDVASYLGFLSTKFSIVDPKICYR